MDPILLIRLLRIIGFAAIIPALTFIVWTILYATRHQPVKQVEKPPKPAKSPKIKEPKKPKAPKNSNEPQKTAEQPPAGTEPQIKEKTVQIRVPDEAKKVELLWNQTPAAGAGWDGSVLE
jgi:FtsZ-interacting cell division protein ZipA